MDPLRSSAASKPTQTTSKLFCAPSADVTFISSDLVLFKIHSSHINSNSAGLAIPEHTILGSEPAPLAEASKVLEILFQFVEPPPESRNYRQPPVHDMELELFFEVAEAAEKYIVYGAVNACFTRMQQLVSQAQAPFDVLMYFDRHGYSDYTDRPEQTISLPRAMVVSKLRAAPDLLRRWLIFYEQWVAVGQEAADIFQNNIPDQCGLWPSLYTLHLCQIAENPTSIHVMPSGYTSPCSTSNCSCQDPQYLEDWGQEVFHMVERPVFHSIK